MTEGEHAFDTLSLGRQAGQNRIRNTVLEGPRSSLVEKLNPVLFSWSVNPDQHGGVTGKPVFDWWRDKVNTMCCLWL